MAYSSTDKYLDNLITALHLRNVPGRQIGQIVAEVEAHIAASGEDPVDAFGPPREYARAWAQTTGRRSTRLGRTRAVVGVVAAGAGGWLLALGVIRTFTGEPVWGGHAVMALLAGLALLAVGAVLAGRDLVIDPRTGAESERLKRAQRQGFVILGTLLAALITVAIVVRLVV